MNFDPKKYKVYTWKNWINIHWMINPGMAINEVILGQRIPKISLLDITSDEPRMERSYIPCPHCKTIHPTKTWSFQNKTAFKNWFGLFCPNCQKTIPCITNIFGFIILAISFPIWGWFRQSLKNNWLAQQPKRYEDLDFEKVPNPYEGNGWISQGLSWGLIMFVIMTFIYPWFEGNSITMQDILIAIPVWTIGGLGFGFSMKLYMANTAKKSTI